MAAQTEKINNLQTHLENTKTDLVYQSKRTKEFQEDAEKQRTDTGKLLRTLEAKG